MQEIEFWDVIERSRRNSTSPDEQADILMEMLMQRKPTDIADFDRFFNRMLGRSYTPELWAAAYIINEGCSNEGFEYFRAWLISKGRQVFEKALADPESLAEIITEEDLQTGELENEPIMYAAREAYVEKTGRQLQLEGYEPYASIELDWNEENVYQKFPKLSEKFG